MAQRDATTPTLDYQRPDTGRQDEKGATSWQFWLAYPLVALPLYCIMGSVPHPIPTDMAVKFYVSLGIAVGAGLFIVRRRPRNVIGWLGLCGWGGFCIAAMIGALAR